MAHRYTGRIQALVVSAGLAPTTRYDETSVPDLLHPRSMYGANVKGAFDVLGVDALGYTCSHVEEVRGIMADRGDGHKPIGVVDMGCGRPTALEP